MSVGDEAELFRKRAGDDVYRSPARFSSSSSHNMAHFLIRSLSSPSVFGLTGDSKCSSRPEALVKEFSSYVFSPLREGDIALYRGSGNGLPPILLVAAEETSLGCVERLEHEYSLQMALAHANRVTTMGQLTASIAHEVRQPIGATVTNAQAALRFLGAEVIDTTELQGILVDIVKDGNRAGEVISRVRDLIKKGAAAERQSGSQWSDPRGG